LGHRTDGCCWIYRVEFGRVEVYVYLPYLICCIGGPGKCCSDRYKIFSLTCAGRISLLLVFIITMDLVITVFAGINVRTFEKSAKDSCDLNGWI
jgi:hypothetical protein